MTGILTKKEWQCLVLHIHSVTGSVHGRVDEEVSRYNYQAYRNGMSAVYVAFQKHRLSLVLTVGFAKGYIFIRDSISFDMTRYFSGTRGILS